MMGEDGLFTLASRTVSDAWYGERDLKSSEGGVTGIWIIGILDALEWRYLIDFGRMRTLWLGKVTCYVLLVRY